MGSLLGRRQVQNVVVVVVVVCACVSIFCLCGVLLASFTFSLSLDFCLHFRRIITFNFLIFEGVSQQANVILGCDMYRVEPGDGNGTKSCECSKQRHSPQCWWCVL